jgi:hypothetical protein
MNHLKLILIILTLIFTTNSFAKSSAIVSPHVTIEDDVYEYIDLLYAHKLVHKVIIGQRPWSRYQIAKLIHQADLNLEESDLSEVNKSYLKDFQNKYRQVYHLEIAKIKGEIKKSKIDFRAIDEIELIFFGLDSPSREYTPNSGSSIEAEFNPFTNNQAGRHLDDGFQHAWEFSSWLQLGSHASIFFKPRFQLQTHRKGEAEDNKVFIQDLYLSLGALNHQLDIGRKPMHWGQSRFGGKIFSNHARSLDTVQLANINPWKIPILGQTKYHFFVADLGAERFISNAKMAGYKIGIKPARFLEFGLARSIIFGGDGNQDDGSFLEMTKEFIGARAGDVNSQNLSNAITGVEAKVSLPILNGMEVYHEMYFDDFSKSRIWDSVKWDTALTFGIYLPRLDKRGSFSLRTEYHINSHVMYRHSQWRSGWTSNDKILGDPLGSEAVAYYLSLEKKFSPEFSLSYDFAFEKIDSNIHISGAGNNPDTVIDQPAEKRFRNIVGFSYSWTKRFNTKLKVGYERVNGFDFIPGDNINNWMAYVNFNYDLDLHY